MALDKKQENTRFQLKNNTRNDRKLQKITFQNLIV